MKKLISLFPSIESTTTGFHLRLPSFRRHRRNSSHPNFSFHTAGSEASNKNEPSSKCNATRSPTNTTTPIHKKISSIFRAPAHFGTPTKQRHHFKDAIHHFRTAKLEESQDPGDLLHQYQFFSLGCCARIDSCQELRRILTLKPHNTEATNYKLSYKVEPEQ